MDTNKITSIDTLGVEVQKVRPTNGGNGTVERKAGKASTLKSWKTLIINLKGLGLTTDKDYGTIKEMYKKAVKQYMGEELL